MPDLSLWTLLWIAFLLVPIAFGLGWLARGWWWRRWERLAWSRHLQFLIPQNKLPLRNTTYSIHDAIFQRSKRRRRETATTKADWETPPFRQRGS